MHIWLVGLGSALGGLSRHWVDLGICAQANLDAYVSIALVNLLGSFLVGWVLLQSQSASRTWYFWGLGFCGGFTTYASFAYLLFDGILNLDPKWVCAYAIGVIFGGMFCFILGAFCAKKLAKGS